MDPSSPEDRVLYECPDMQLYRLFNIKQTLESSATSNYQEIDSVLLPARLRALRHIMSEYENLVSTSFIMTLDGNNVGLAGDELGQDRNYKIDNIKSILTQVEDEMKVTFRCMVELWDIMNILEENNSLSDRNKASFEDLARLDGDIREHIAAMKEKIKIIEENSEE